MSFFSPEKAALLAQTRLERERGAREALLHYETTAFSGFVSEIVQAGWNVTPHDVARALEETTAEGDYVTRVVHAGDVPLTSTVRGLLPADFHFRMARTVFAAFKMPRADVDSFRKMVRDPSMPEFETISLPKAVYQRPVKVCLMSPVETVFFTLSYAARRLARHMSTVAPCELDADVQLRLYSGRFNTSSSEQIEALHRDPQPTTARTVVLYLNDPVLPTRYTREPLPADGPLFTSDTPGRQGLYWQTCNSAAQPYAAENLHQGDAFYFQGGTCHQAPVPVAGRFVMLFSINFFKGNPESAAEEAAIRSFVPAFPPRVCFEDDARRTLLVTSDVPSE